MQYTVKKTVSEIITTLKKLPYPGKKTGSFWEFMKSQLTDEGEWDQKHIKVIEKEIDKFLTKVDKKSLIEMWKETQTGNEKSGQSKKPDIKEMKADLTEEILGRVMDQMDENYAARDPLFKHEEPVYDTKKEIDKEGANLDFDMDNEPEEIPDEDIELDKNNTFDENDTDDDEFKY
ncbi:MAG: hypothetical protein AB1432_12045 [Bacteroidota bacterium]